MSNVDNTVDFGFDDVKALLDVIPHSITQAIYSSVSISEIIEIVLDIGRQLEVRLLNNEIIIIPHVIERMIIAAITDRIGQFGPDDRAGLDNCLHRISKIENRQGQIVGLTLRVGRDFPASIDLFKEFVDLGESVLIVGKPGIGKTTMLRATAKYLSKQKGKKVIIVDTSNEIAGDGDLPHSAIGRSRRMQVPYNKTQAEIMIRAVENHNPDIIIVDEISTAEEAAACITIAERGVQLIATAHGKELENLIRNKPFQDLVGGIATVTLSDETAIRNGMSKTRQERKFEPPFSILVELLNYNEVRIHSDLQQAVDIILSGGRAIPEHRIMVDDSVRVVSKGLLAPPQSDLDSPDSNTNKKEPFISSKEKTNPRLVPKKTK